MSINDETMITADPSTPLGRMCRKVADLKPGQGVDFTRDDFEGIHRLWLKDGTCLSPPERVLESIVGSIHTHRLHIRPDGTVSFTRHENTFWRREDPR